MMDAQLSGAGDIPRPIRFEIDDLRLFGRASHDRNPLHLDDAYARKTPYGQRVVFGVLGLLACLTRLEGRAGFVISGIDVQFLAPILVGIDYATETEERSEEETVVRLNDGKRALLQARVRFRRGEMVAQPGPDSTPPPCLQSTALTPDVLSPGHRVSGTYAPDWSSLRRLLRCIDFARGDIAPEHLATLLWSSYIVGMELPGRQALFSRLKLEFDAPVDGSITLLQYRAQITQFDRRFSRLVVDASVSSKDRSLARGTIESFVRAESTDRVYLPASAPTQRSGALAGKVALVVGGSRGLGASVVRSLALEACDVYVNFWQSRDDAERLQGSLVGAPGAVRPVQGDAGDRSSCEAIRQSIVDATGRLDFLLCSATPPVLPLLLESSAVERVNEFIRRSLSLVNVPLAVFLDLLSASAGRATIVSSRYVHTLPVEWPHYVAAKAAAEAMTHVAAGQYPSVSFLLVRPPRLATDLSSSPFAYETALATDVVAGAIIDYMSRPAHPGAVDVMEISASGEVSTSDSVYRTAI